MDQDKNKLNVKNSLFGIKDIMYKFKLNINKKDITTGLYNRKYFFNYLTRKMNGSFIKIKFIGIDFVNLSCGIDSSNEMIKLISKRLKEMNEEFVVTMLSRTKFGIYTETTDIEEIKEIIYDIILMANRINEEIENINISVNVAAVIYDKDDFNVVDAIDKLEVSISSAIRRGINKYEIYNEKYEPYITVESIQKAIYEGDIVLYYQPKVDVKSGRINGVEALIRWFNKEHGYIPPDKLIGYAENSGYINVLGRWIVKKACEEIKKINNRLHDKIDLSVNISPYQLENEKFLDEIKEIIDETGFEEELLKLEITENENIESIDKIHEIFEEIKYTGMKVSIDDFGKGYNSIDYIKNYNVDEIKIDKSLVEYLSNNPLFIKSLINMIHTTDTLVVAEGVEEHFEYEYLQNMGCDMIQGYYFYKPMELEHLLETIKEEAV